MKQTWLERQGEFEEHYNHGGNFKRGKAITALFNIIFNAVIKNEDIINMGKEEAKLSLFARNNARNKTDEPRAQQDSVR